MTPVFLIKPLQPRLGAEIEQGGGVLPGQPEQTASDPPPLIPGQHQQLGDSPEEIPIGENPQTAHQGLSLIGRDVERLLQGVLGLLGVILPGQT